jgi:hypothetical protein
MHTPALHAIMFKPKNGFTSGFKKNYTGPRLQLDTQKTKRCFTISCGGI